MIRNHETGVLCSTPYEWYREISHLLDDADERVRLGEAAFTWCRSNATTAGTGQALARYITKHQTKNIVFVLPSLNTSGGVLVGLRHAFAICAYGQSPYLRECIESVLNQQDGDDHPVKSEVFIATATPSAWLDGIAADYGLAVVVNDGEHEDWWRDAKDATEAKYAKQGQ